MNSASRNTYDSRTNPRYIPKQLCPGIWRIWDDRHQGYVPGSFANKQQAEQHIKDRTVPCK